MATRAKCWIQRWIWAAAAEISRKRLCRLRQVEFFAGSDFASKPSDFGKQGDTESSLQTLINSSRSRRKLSWIVTCFTCCWHFFLSSLSSNGPRSLESGHFGPLMEALVPYNGSWCSQHPGPHKQDKKCTPESGQHSRYEDVDASMPNCMQNMFEVWSTKTCYSLPSDLVFNMRTEHVAPRFSCLGDVGVSLLVTGAAFRDVGLFLKR